MQDWLEKLAAVDESAAEILDARRRPKDYEIPDGAGFILRAWSDLQSDRLISGGMAPQYLPISFSSIDAWARRYKIEGDAFDILKKCIRELDRVYLAHFNAPPSDKTEGT